MNFPAKSYFLLIGLISFQSAFTQNDTLNQLDEEGKKQGYWIIYGKDKPESGYHSESKVEEGYYLNSRREGMWVKYYKEGGEPRLHGTYRNGRPNGPYIKYYPSGCVWEKGSFSGVSKSFDEFYNFYDYCDCDSSREGRLREEKYEEDSCTVKKEYFPNGQLKTHIRRKGKNGEGFRINFYPNGDTMRVVDFDTDGSILSKRDFLRLNPSVDPDPLRIGPDPKTIHRPKPKQPFDKNGHNKIYDKEGNLWMEGEFKDGKLYDGKVYRYDDDGILLKIEIWKGGKKE